MIPIRIIFLLLLFHYIGDFILQTDDMAKNKSKSIGYLTAHAYTYCLPFIFISPWFMAFTMPMHMFIDGITSKITSRLWKEGKVHKFFLTIGTDQLIHYVLLIWLYKLLFL